ncbi:cytochrome P450 monooxygenase-like protein [Paraphoma chrysanthemicola]|nr:cytochrome P450 monooxygenase-like protein [Paraphoma chrysanthemicola]
MYLYNLYFHPLRNFPGPAFAAASYMPWLYHRVNGSSRHWHVELHDQYGSVVLTGPTFLSFTEPQAWKDIYSHRTATHQTNAKDWRFYGPPRNVGEYSINNIPTDEHHGKVRRIFASAFSDRALRLQEPLICRHVDKLIYNVREIISNRSTARIDMVQMYNFMTFDIMSNLAFGQTTGMIDSGEPSPWLKIVYGYVKATNLLVAIRFYHIFRPLSGLFISRQDVVAQRRHFENTTNLLNDRLAQGREEPDIWNLVEARNAMFLTNGEIHANAAVFMSAGTETTATQLSGITYLLLSHPEKLHKLVYEVRSFPHVEGLSLARIAQLPYLNACLQEGLRLYPPIAEGLPRWIAHNSGTVLGHHLAPGTSVYVSPYATNRSPANFEDPNTFSPERWLPESRYDSDRRDALQPFSTGPRNCLGINLAYHEMRLALARVLYSFDLELEDHAEDWIAAQKTYV